MVRRGEQVAFSKGLVLRPDELIRGPQVQVTGAAAFRASIGLPPHRDGVLESSS